MKRFKNLNSTGKEILYAASGFGANLMMILMGAYFSDAVNPTALGASASASLQAITGTCLVMPALFAVLGVIGKVFDGLIDIPFASITDNLKTKWGRRRLPIAICLIPMIVSYLFCWWPVFGDNQLGNTIWIFVWQIIFFATYTMNLIAFYGSLSTVCADEKQRLRVSAFKSFFDTICYVLVYALVPVLLKATNLHIDKFVFIISPLMLTMIIPLFMIKEGEKWEKKAIAEGYDIVPLAEEENVGLVEAFKGTFKNKPFMAWTIVNCCSFFGLQMFLVAMNALIIGGMGLDSLGMTILNTCAFAPVPLMLYLFNKLKAKKGIRFAYQIALLSFAVAIMSFLLGSQLIMGDKTTVKIIIGCVGGVFGSFGIGAFFMMPYMIPAQISSVEEKLTKKNKSAMFFAVQAFTSSVVGAVASYGVYEIIKNYFFSTKASGLIYTTGDAETKAVEAAAQKFGVDVSTVVNLGTFLVPIVVCVFCLIGFAFSFRMLKNYSPKEVAYGLGLEKEYEENKQLFPPERIYAFEASSLIVNNVLWVLTGSIMGWIWEYYMIDAVNTFGKKTSKWLVLPCILIPPFQAFLTYRLNKEVEKKCDELGIEYQHNGILATVMSFLCLSFVGLSLVQHKLNKIANELNKKEDEVRAE
ncbi:MAG: MFS transporter [Bacilli bacterium]|nr:MFS transporter [Bacilli bacterium]